MVCWCKYEAFQIEQQNRVIGMYRFDRYVVVNTHYSSRLLCCFKQEQKKCSMQIWSSLTVSSNDVCIRSNWISLNSTCDRHGFLCTTNAQKKERNQIDWENHKHCKINTVSRTKLILLAYIMWDYYCLFSCACVFALLFPIKCRITVIIIDNIMAIDGRAHKKIDFNQNATIFLLPNCWAIDNIVSMLMCIVHTCTNLFLIQHFSSLHLQSHKWICKFSMKLFFFLCTVRNWLTGLLDHWLHTYGVHTGAIK